ncbi:MAG: energy transducer TonB [Rhodothermales bacterium]
MHRSQREARQHRYAIRIQLGCIVALSLMIAAFNADVQLGEAAPPDRPATAAPVFKEISPTQPLTPPPPPRPPVPVTIPDDAPPPADELNLRLDPFDDITSGSLPPPPADPDKDGEDEVATFLPVEDMPQLIGGMESLYERVVYPEMAKQAGLEGKVIVQFVVDREGRVQHPVVLRGVHTLLDEAALEAVRGLRFHPGKQRDRPVPVKMSLPITFKLR